MEINFYIFTLKRFDKIIIFKNWKDSYIAIIIIILLLSESILYLYLNCCRYKKSLRAFILILKSLNGQLPWILGCGSRKKG